jgi:Fe-S cluster biogenesis protein NfuA
MEISEKQIITEKIIKTLEAVKPYLQADGGDISFIDLTDDMTVKVQLHGACNACPMSIQTLKFGVEQALMSVIPEIKNVEAVDFLI